MKELNPEELYQDNIPKAIKLLSDEIGRTKNPDKKAKLEKALKELKNLPNRLEEVINKTKKVKLVNATKANNTEKTFYKEFIEGNEHLVDLIWLRSKMESEKAKGNIDASTTAEADSVAKEKAKTLDVKFSFVDRTKSVANQILSGKGISKWLSRGFLAVGIGEIMSQGVTSLLAKEGIMKSATGLFGVAKIGVEALPKLWPILTNGVQMIMGLPNPVLFAGAGLAVVHGIPMVKNLVDKIRKRHKEAHAFENGMENLLKSQQAQAGLQI